MLMLHLEGTHALCKCDLILRNYEVYLGKSEMDGFIMLECIHVYALP